MARYSGKNTESKRNRGTNKQIRRAREKIEDVLDEIESDE